MAVALEPCIAEPGVLRGQFARRDAGVAAMLLVALWSFRGYADYRRTAFAVLLVTGLSYIAVAAIFNLQIAGRMGAADQRVGQCNGIETGSMEADLGHVSGQPFHRQRPGNLVQNYPAYRSPMDNGTFGYYAHNDYLQIAQEGGLLVLVIFVLVAAYAVWLAWRALKAARFSRERAMEAGLMLAVGTVYLQAVVNFMFYLVYVSVWTGLYLGRVAQVTGTVRSDPPPKAIAAAPGQFRLLMVLALLVPIAQISIHGLSSALLEGSPMMGALKRVAPQLSGYDLASAITTVWPNEYVAQRYVVESQAQALEQQSRLPVPIRTALFEDTISRYESLRRAMADDPDLAVAEARLWLDQAQTVSEQTRIGQARKLAAEALRRDPRHVDAIRLLAQTYFLAGRSQSRIRDFGSGHAQRAVCS